MSEVKLTRYMMEKAEVDEVTAIRILSAMIRIFGNKISKECIDELITESKDAKCAPLDMILETCDALCL